MDWSYLLIATVAVVRLAMMSEFVIIGAVIALGY
jgi:hypothetical protein